MPVLVLYWWSRTTLMSVARKRVFFFQFVTVATYYRRVIVQVHCIECFLITKTSPPPGGFIINTLSIVFNESPRVTRITVPRVRLYYRPPMSFKCTTPFLIQIHEEVSLSQKGSLNNY